jgi:hypothetical protein
MWTCIRRANGAAERWQFRRAVASTPLGWAPVALAAALVLAGCQTEQQAAVAAAQPRGATVAFESIDGLPQDRFHALVQDLNGEAQLRRLAVLSRGQPSAYRVRGYFAAAVEHGRTTISWVWDVFDSQEQRAFRISGSEDGKSAKAWDAVDDAMLRRIARSGMEQLAAFLTSPSVAPNAPAPAEEPRLALSGDDSTPEAAGIFRVSQPQADPLASGAPPENTAAPVRLPPKRPDGRSAAVKTVRPVTLVAAGISLVPRVRSYCRAKAADSAGAAYCRAHHVLL